MTHTHTQARVLNDFEFARASFWDCLVWLVVGLAVRSGAFFLDGTLYALRWVFLIQSNRCCSMYVRSNTCHNDRATHDTTLHYTLHYFVTVKSFFNCWEFLDFVDIASLIPCLFMAGGDSFKRRYEHVGAVCAVWVCGITLPCGGSGSYEEEPFLSMKVISEITLCVNW